ncbi:diguanylate cyclase [uncultured Azohydromonas sp.]|jgi:diguanylate cyclase (GGDEF) domain|uniref:diguanylate cyclase n=1 Tax=uncultured Azohydromonas sp. TaxID=487342 RepID=UPI002601CF2A|nr:diguanylate cyclase [uncultured Azohydromonas sp.]
MKPTPDGILMPGAEPPRLLLVDDQPANIHALHQVFVDSGCRLLMATQGEQALVLCRERQPDLVLLDMCMPGLGGIEVCARLKAEPATRDIPVIFITALQDEANETRALDAGAVDFIVKPFNPRVVRARVRTHLTLKAQADQLRRLALVDGLTGVYNRRHFDEQLVLEWRRAQREGSTLSLLIADIDHFKAFNDRFGHQAGDDCLRRVAQQLQAGLRRPGDLVARWGGEEFACILPRTEAAGARHLAHQLGAGVRALALAHPDSPPGVVTLSLGVATARPQLMDDAAALFARADAQLYRAKSEGRARACSEEA